MSSNDTTINIRARNYTDKAFSDASLSMRNLKQGAHQLGSAFKTLAGLAAVVVGPAALGAIVKSNLESVDSLAKTADKIGETTERLAGLRHAAEQTGVSSNTLDMAMQRLTRRVAEASAGTGEAKDALKELGLNAQELNLDSPSEKMYKIAEALKGVENESDKVRLAFKLFDSEGVSLVNTLSAGADGLREYQTEAENLGIAINRVDAKKIENANDAMDRLRKAAIGVGRTITVALAPVIAVIAKRFEELGGGAVNWRRVTLDAIEGVAVSIAFLGDAFQGLKVIWKTLELAFAAVVAGIATGINELTKNILAIGSYIPVVGDGFAEVNKQITQFASSARGVVYDLGVEIKDIATGPGSSEGVKQFFADIRAEAAEAERAVATSLSADAPIDFEALLEKTREQEVAKVAVKQAVKQDELLMNEDHVRRLGESLALLNEMNNNAEINTLQNHNNQKIKIQALADRTRARNTIKTETELDKFLAMSWDSKVKTISSSLVHITSTVASENRAMFQINKVAAIADAGINAFQGASKSLAAYPWPFAQIMAGIHLAAGFAQIRAIQSRTFGDGGGGGYTPSSPAGRAPSAYLPTSQPSYSSGSSSIFQSSSTPQQTEPKKIFNISIQGNPTKDQVRELIENINEEVRDGAELIVT